jgi:hypothetical protein
VTDVDVKDVVGVVDAEDGVGRVPVDRKYFGRHVGQRDHREKKSEHDSTHFLNGHVKIRNCQFVTYFVNKPEVTVVSVCS